MQLPYADYSTALKTYLLQVHGTLHWGHTFLQVYDTTCMVEANDQWRRYARALYRYAPNTRAKLALTPRGRKQHHVNKCMLWRQQGQAKWLTGASTASTRILYLCEEAVLRKTPCFKSIDCSTEAIRRSSWPTRYGMQKANWTHTHTHTQLL